MASLTALKSRLADLNALDSALSILDWDQQVLMPPKAVEARAAHSSALGRMRHELLTSDETLRLIESSKSEVDTASVDGALLRVVSRMADLATKIPAALVAEKYKLASEGHEAWVEARKANDFPKFAPILERMFEIAREEANYLGYKEHIYDALLDQFEEGATKADCDRMFGEVRQPLVDLVREIKEAGHDFDDHFLNGDWDEAKQRSFTERLVAAIGFDMARGRQDTAPHPFCTNFSISDVRLTTRFKSYLPSAIFGSLHEAGHGMYEQGSPMEWDRTYLAGGVSLGLHESQSRLWENIVGRSFAFWRYFLHELQAIFPPIAAFGAEQFYRMINRVEPSLIRVEADEVTYNLHILIRFEIECAILTGELAVKDLPEAWNAKYQSYLGILPPTDSDGCLQDVHWSMGAIGYFPTYSMGNLLSYQIWSALKKDIPNPDDLMARGEFGPIHEWLRTKIYAQGKRFPPKDLVLSVTGKPMGGVDYIEGIGAKYRSLYGI
ncbi:MAG TPA: carboxypeptidase M32 [Fimbriimonadaceae bacterium]|nr:carboxypeptidase M32 [Fimbriimonadaceae bacterium]